MAPLMVPFMASLVLLAPVGCTKPVGDALSPETNANAGAGAGVLDCSGPIGRIEPLTIDWDPAARAELQAAMQASVVVVKYSCPSVEILPGCSAAGSYRYAGVSPSEQALGLESIDELHANIPLGAAKLGSELQAGQTVELSTALVGRRSTTLTNLASAALIGECEGATHFVRSAALGAFSIALGGEARSSEGEPGACTSAELSAAKPPADCQTPIRIELLPIVGGAQTAAQHSQASKIVAAESPCLPAYVWSAGICTRPQADRPQLCAPADQADCAAQCSKGDAESCFNYGRLIAPASGSAPGPSQVPLTQACEANSYEACTLLGELLWYDPNHDAQAIETALQLVTKGCEGGVGYACDLAGDILSDKSLPSPDLARAFAHYNRACDLGEGVGCTFAAARLFKGEGVAKDPSAGLERLARSCEAGSIHECGDMGSILAKGKYGAPTDPARALEYLAPSCTADPAWCEEAGDTAAVVGDAEQAKRFYALACAHDSGSASCSKIK
jgi:uncharacterized protein